MSLLKVEQLTQGFGNQQLYRDVSFEVYKGEHIGVVGQNGAGKSTLIHILTGEQIPDNGTVVWQKGIRIGQLDQYAQGVWQQSLLNFLKGAFTAFYKMEQEMLWLYEQSAQSGDGAMLQRAARLQEQLQAQDFYNIGHRLQRVATGLGLDAIGLEKPMGQLSGGQRAKAILAKILLEEPEVLLLDEPTNFLDKEHVDWIADWLTGFSGTFLVVSHDAAFLGRIATTVLDVAYGSIQKYYGTYAEFLKQKTFLREEYIRQYRAQQRHIEKTEAYIRKNKAGVNAKMARGRQKQLDRLERLAPPPVSETISFSFLALEQAAQTALQVKGLQVGYDAPLLPGLDFIVERGQKLVITGFNGIGKSTLLKTLVGQLPPLAGKFSFAEGSRIGYFAQELRWETPENTPLEILAQQFPQKSTKELRRALARCGVTSELVSQAVQQLSGGEQCKVKLCMMMHKPYHILILDEPTNHLDQQAKEELQRAIRVFPGSVLLVSHEEKFYRDWVDKVFSIEDCLK